MVRSKSIFLWEGVKILYKRNGQRNTFCYTMRSLDGMLVKKGSSVKLSVPLACSSWSQTKKFAPAGHYYFQLLFVNVFIVFNALNIDSPVFIKKIERKVLYIKVNVIIQTFEPDILET